MMGTITPETRRRLLGEGGLHPLLAELIRAIDRHRGRPTSGSLEALGEAEDAYLESLEEGQ